MNRCREAREQAGLTLGQAARRLGMGESFLHALEDPRMEDLLEFEELSDRTKHAMAETYGVSEEWLNGEGPDRDYAAVRAMKGSEDLSFHDRDILAKFIASLPWRSK